MQNNGVKELNNRAKNERSILKTLLVASLCGFVGVVGFPITSGVCLDKNCVGTSLLFIGLLIACASFVSGFFTGTLFGIPKRTSANAAGDYALNNSLVEISEWLTKIIVGLGLANLTKIPESLVSMGDYVAQYAGMKQSLANVYTITIVVYFIVLGLYIGYNYMRLVLSVLYKGADDEVVSKQSKEIAANAAMDVYTDSVNSDDPTAFDKLLNTVISVKEKLQTNFKAKIPSSADYSNLVSRAKLKMQKGLADQGSLAVQYQDPNKNQWGGKSQNNGKIITATVQSMEDKDLFRVSMQIISADAANPLSEGEVVLFALHNSFPDPFKLSVVKNGVARLDVISWGAFTVGAFADDGNTELELDLSKIQGAPESFVNS